MIKRLLLAFTVFVELTLLGGLVAIVSLGRLNDNAPVLIWAAGVVVALSFAVAFALPAAWARKVALHGALICGSLIFMMPCVWLVTTAAKYPEETFVFPPRWL